MKGGGAISTSNCFINTRLELDLIIIQLELAFTKFWFLFLFLLDNKTSNSILAFILNPCLSTPTPPPRESTVEDISGLWNHPWLLTSGPVPYDHATFVHATFVRATFFHATFVQGQYLVIYNCNHSCLDQTIKFQTSYWAQLGQLQLILSLAQLSPSLFLYFLVTLPLSEWVTSILGICWD